MNNVAMVRTSMRCERCGASTFSSPAGASDQSFGLCSTCRARSTRSTGGARRYEEEAIALAELAATDLDIAMLKEGK